VASSGGSETRERHRIEIRGDAQLTARSLTVDETRSGLRDTSDRPEPGAVERDQGWPGRAFAPAQALVRNLPPTGSPEDDFLREFLGGMVALAAGARDELGEETLRRALAHGLGIAVADARAIP
jgi:hypothetical protein